MLDRVWVCSVDWLSGLSPSLAWTTCSNGWVFHVSLFKACYGPFGASFGYVGAEVDALVGFEYLGCDVVLLLKVGLCWSPCHTALLIGISFEICFGSAFRYVDAMCSQVSAMATQVFGL